MTSGNDKSRTTDGLGHDTSVLNVSDIEFISDIIKPLADRGFIDSASGVVVADIQQALDNIITRVREAEKRDIAATIRVNVSIRRPFSVDV